MSKGILTPLKMRLCAFVTAVYLVLRILKQTHSDVSNITPNKDVLLDKPSIEKLRKKKQFSIKIHNPKMSSIKEEVKHVDKELDLSNAGRGVWLVKVPKYLANRWEKLPGSDVGKLRITKQSGQKTQVSLVLDDCVNDVDSEEPVPKNHQLDVTIVKQQTLGVFSHTTR